MCLAHAFWQDAPTDNLPVDFLTWLLLGLWYWPNKEPPPLGEHILAMKLTISKTGDWW